MIRKETTRFLVLLLISTILFYLDKSVWLKPVRGWVERPIIAAEKEIYLAGRRVTGLFDFISSRSAQEQELLRLQIELQRLAVDQNQLLTCQAENERIKKLLGTPLPTDWKFLPASVAGINNLMVLDKGEKAGVQVGQNVISENIFVGKVTSTSAYSSLVQLPTSNNSKIPVVIKRAVTASTTNSQPIQARGLLMNSAGQLILDKVTQTEDIQKGDLVVSLADEGYLGDLVIGQIVEVMEKSAEIFQKAKVIPMVDYRQLEIVFVVLR